MPTALLILLALFLPLVWGWAMHLLLAKLWPAKPPGSGDRGPAAQQRPRTAIDYQI